jgi:hypothetical protein
MEQAINNMNIRSGTKLNYHTKAKKCIQLGINILGNETRIVHDINLLKNEKKSCIMAYINVCLVIRREMGYSYDLLVELRDMKAKELEDHVTETNESINFKELPTVETLRSFMNEQYTNGDYEGYVINYLLIELNCRNKDLDAYITLNEPAVRANYLWIQGNSVTFIRHKYKTVYTYGPKLNVINDPKFVESCKRILYGKQLDYLLKKSNGERIKDPSTHIPTKTFNSMTQTMYFKIITSSAKKQDLLKLSKNRGTSVATILSFYDLDK